MNRKPLLLLIVLLSIARSNLAAQTPSDSSAFLRDDTPWYLQRKTLVTAGVAAQTLVSAYIEYSWWWKGNYHAFQFENDGFWNNYSLGVDKFGHFYTSYFYYNALRELLVWGDYKPSTAEWVSAGITFFYALSIEVGDGFSTFAFSASDLTANTLGIAYGFLQHRIPVLGNFSFKWSYYPSGIIPFDGYWRLTDDYDGHIYWLSIDVHNLLPESAKSYWPAFLNLAIGYGGENISDRPPWVNGTPISSPGVSARKLAVSLDYNLSSLPTSTDTWTALKRIVDKFHFPGPGVRSIESKSAEAKVLLLY